MFEKASRLKARFNYKGSLSAEDLWDLSVQALDSIFKKLNAKAKIQSEESLLAIPSTADTLLALKIEIVKHVVKVLLAEKEARKNAASEKQRKQKILAMIDQKDDEALMRKTKEELMTLL